MDSRGWSRIVDRLGGTAALAASALAHGAFQRPRGVRSASDLLRLCLMYGPGGHSLRGLSTLSSSCGVASVSDVALLKRIRGSADWLEALCRTALADAARGFDASLDGRVIRIVDGSRLQGPGGQAWRLHLCYDPAGGRLVEAVITTLGQGERLDRHAVRPGEIRLADRGFPQPDGLKNVLAAGAEVLVRLTWNSLRLSDAAGQPLDWLALFAQASEAGALDLPVRLLKAHARFTPLELRLLVIRKPPEAAAQARAKASRASRKNQHRRTDPRTLAGAEHLVLITSLQAQDFPIERLAALYRLRWQIELAFKRLKSILHIDRLPARDDALARAWLQAHLLFALLVDDATAELADFPP